MCHMYVAALFLTACDFTFTPMVIHRPCHGRCGCKVRGVLEQRCGCGSGRGGGHTLSGACVQLPRRPPGHPGGPQPHPGVQMMAQDQMAGAPPMGIMHVPQAQQHHHMAAMHPGMPPGAAQQPPSGR